MTASAKPQAAVVGYLVNKVMAKVAANAAAVAWQKLPLPALDERRCIACGRCVAVCPSNCLAMDGPLAWLPRPLDCIRCGACAFVCPTAAIAVPLDP